MKTTDPIKSLLGVPGIGVTYAQRLVSIGITGPSDLLHQYIKLDRNELQFRNWMKISCRTHSNHAIKCFEKIRALDKVHIRCIPTERSNFIFPRPLSCYTLLEVPMRNICVHSVVFCSNNVMAIHPSAVIPYAAVSNSKKNNEERRPHAQYERMHKLNKKFSSIKNGANSKIRALQIDLSRMEEISQEFNEISRQSITTRRVNTIEEHMLRCEETLITLNSKLSEMMANQRKLTNAFGHHSDIWKKQHNLSLARARDVQNRLKIEMENYNLEFASLAKNNNETMRTMMKMEKMAQANMDLLFKDIHRTRHMQKGILSICFIFLSVLVLNCANKNLLFDLKLKREAT